MRSDSGHDAAPLDSAAEIRLVVNADDFGMSPAISRGILRAHREGIVTSTSVLGNCDDLDAGARDARGGARAGRGRAPGAGGRRSRRRRRPRAVVAGAPAAASTSAAPSSSPPGRKRQIDAGRRRTRVRRAGRARARRGHRDRSPGHAPPPRVSPASSGARSRRWRGGTASRPSAARSRRRRWRGSPTRGAGSRPAC